MKRRNFILSMLAACVIGCSSPVSTEDAPKPNNENIITVNVIFCTGIIDDTIIILQDFVPIDTLFYVDDSINTAYGIFRGTIFVDKTKIVQMDYSCYDGNTPRRLPRFYRYRNLDLIDDYQNGYKTIGDCMCR